MDDRGRRCSRVALLIALAAGCSRELEPPVAPFGGELAAALPSRDVIGMLRFAPGGAPAKAMLGFLRGVEEGQPVLRSFVTPPAAVLSLLADSAFAPADRPFVVVLLDTSVHGGFAAFAWSGGAEKFRAAARERGWIRGDPDEVELPDVVRVNGMLDTAIELARQQRREKEEEEGLEVVERAPYHLVERDGATLLLPARDGARNVLDSLARTHALDPAAGAADCFRFTLGPALHKSREHVDDMLTGGLSFALAGLRERGRARLGVNDEVMRDNFGQVWGRAWRLMRQLLDVADSIEHVFVQLEPDGAEIYLRADADGFFRKLLPIAHDVPIDALLEGAPMDADVLFASSLDASLIDDVEARWFASTRGVFQQERRRIRAARARRERDAEEGDEKPTFLDSFGGRCWIALSEAPSDAKLPVEARIFAQQVDEEGNEGLLRALVRTILPDGIFQGVQTASLLAYAAGRVPGGLIEVVGSKPSELLSSERRRLAAPETAQVPDGQPASGFLFLLGGGDDPFVLTGSSDADGVRLKVTVRRS
jgi:hypothetical protein